MKTRVRAPSPRYSKALSEMEKRVPNEEKAFAHLQAAHQSGDPRATYAIGTWYLHGRYVKRDKRKGLELIRNAAECDVRDALFDYAVSLETGDGVRKSLSHAAKNYLKAALLGDSQAMYEVGRCFYYGIGVRTNRQLARVFLDVAAHDLSRKPVIASSHTKTAPKNNTQ